jgi:pheromone shutdown-related protein TraB
MTPDVNGGAPDATEALLAAQPTQTLRLGRVEFLLLGTAHVSKASADAVQALIAQQHFDAIAIELDAGRQHALLNPDAYLRLDLFEVIKSQKVALVVANLALSAYQRRIANESGVEPGAEMLAAIQGAQARDLPLWLIDREVSLTLARCRAALGFWGGSKLMVSLFLGSIISDEVDAADVEKLKQRDLLQSTFAEFQQDTPALFEALIAERDRFMAAKLIDAANAWSDQPANGAAPEKKVLVVIGAGHLAGTAAALQSHSAAPEKIAETLESLSERPAPSRVPKMIGLALLAVLVLGLAYGFSKGFDVGKEFLLIYLGMTAGGTLLGALAAGAHPISAIVAAISAPITVLHPAISSGMVAAAVELWLKRPTVADFEHLKTDLNEVKGFWRNGVARIFTIFALTCVGTTIGVYITTAWFIQKIG